MDDTEEWISIAQNNNGKMENFPSELPCFTPIDEAQSGKRIITVTKAIKKRKIPQKYTTTKKNEANTML